MGVAELDDETGILTLHARIYCYGTAANADIAQRVGQNITDSWNKPQAIVTIKKKQYTVQFQVQGMYAPKLTPDEVHNNTSYINNYVRIEDYADGNISFVDAINCNTGYFKYDNLLDGSTTAAHEFGHSLGLQHPANLDIRGQGVPGIMYPRGTVCDPAYQYDPNAAPLAPGGTMDPKKRVVKQEDIDHLQLNKLPYNKYGQAVVGALTSVWHYKHEKKNDNHIS